MMHVFSVYAFHEGDGYGIHIEVPEDVPMDIVYKVAKEVADKIETAPVSEAEEAQEALDNYNKYDV